MAEVLVTNSYFRLTFEGDRLLVRFVRTRQPFPSLDAIDQAFEPACDALDRQGRNRCTAFADLRDAPLNNDPLFEQVMGRWRQRMFKGFARVAFLVRTVSGSLQVKRHVREDGVDGMQVFMDEATALAYATDTKVGPRDNEPNSGVVEVYGSNSKLRPKGRKVQ